MDLLYSPTLDSASGLTNTRNSPLERHLCAHATKCLAFVVTMRAGGPRGSPLRREESADLRLAQPDEQVDAERCLNQYDDAIRPRAPRRDVCP